MVYIVMDNIVVMEEIRRLCRISVFCVGVIVFFVDFDWYCNGFFVGVEVINRLLLWRFLVFFIFLCLGFMDINEVYVEMLKYCFMMF